jgi:hypothetical protein
VGGGQVERLEALSEAIDGLDFGRERAGRGEGPPGEIGAGDGDHRVERGHQRMVHHEEPASVDEALEEASRPHARHLDRHVGEHRLQIGEGDADVAEAMVGVLHADDERGLPSAAQDLLAEASARREDGAAVAGIGEEAGADVGREDREIEALRGGEVDGLGGPAIGLEGRVGRAHVAVEIAAEEHPPGAVVACRGELVPRRDRLGAVGAVHRRTHDRA